MALPIRTRLTAVTAALIAGVLAIGGVLLYVQLRADLIHAVDSGLRSRADALIPTLQDPDGSVDTPAGLTETDEAFAQILDRDGTVLGSTAGLQAQPLLSPSEMATLERARFLEREVRTGEEPVPARLLAIPVDARRVVVLGASLEDQHEALTRLWVLLTVGGPVALAIITAIGWAVTGAALRPIEAMRKQAAEIHGAAPGRRLPVPPTTDEVARLATTLNEMLDRLEEALERERRFVADAGHELRTPLANLRMELDLALRRARTPAELQAAVRSAAEETDRLSRLAEDLLVLARADGGQLPLRREPTDVGEVIRSATATFAARTTDRRVRMRADAPEGLIANVDPLRLSQAVGNLVDNAIRYTPTEGTVAVAAERVDGSIRIVVTDTGPGFAPAFIEDAFEPFARPDTGRSRPDGGTGLGLAIVRAVAEAHGGTVTAANRPEGGGSVVLSLPAWEASTSLELTEVSGP